MSKQAILCALAAAVAVVFATLPSAASDGPDVTTALARTFVRESGLRAYARDDAAAIYEVVRWRSEHIYRSSFLDGLRRATRGAFERADTRRAWIVELGRPFARRPEGYPSHLSWRRMRRHWRRTYVHARRALAGRVHHRCGLTPHAWGDYYDGERFERANPTAIELDCGDVCLRDAHGSPRLDERGNPMCNRFFHVRRYGDRFGPA